MEFHLEIKEEAALEIAKAYLYYQDKRLGLGEEFLDHLNIYFNRNCFSP